MCPPSEGTTTALQPLTVVVHLVARHRRLRQGVGYPPDGTQGGMRHARLEGMAEGEMESGGYPSTSAPPPTCERENLDSRLRGNDGVEGRG